MASRPAVPAGRRNGGGKADADRKPDQPENILRPPQTHGPQSPPNPPRARSRGLCGATLALAALSAAGAGGPGPAQAETVVEGARSASPVIDIAAEPGLGKSRLVHEFLQRIPADGTTAVLIGHCARDGAHMPSHRAAPVQSRNVGGPVPGSVSPVGRLSRMPDCGARR